MWRLLDLTNGKYISTIFFNGSSYTKTDIFPSKKMAKKVLTLYLEKSDKRHKGQFEIIEVNHT